MAKAESDYYESCRATCKNCYKARARAYRAANIERIKEYDRNRPNAEQRAAAHKERYNWNRMDDETKRRLLSHKANWEARNRQKRRAQNLAAAAIKSGKLIPQPCQRCGFTFGINGHHEDYSKPLDVIWLCKKCHGQRHREINAERRRAA